MKTMKALLVAGLFGLTTMCGGQAPVDGDASSADQALTTTIGVRIRGDNAGSLTSVSTKAHAVAVWSDGVPVAVTLTGQTMNLANTGQAWLVASFVLPAGANHVRVSTQLNDSATYAGGGGSGSIDLRGAPMVLDVLASELEARGKIVLHADLARSIVDDAGGKVFLPQLRIAF